MSETTEPTTDRVRHIIATYLGRDIADDLTDLETDSLENVEIGMEIEEAFGIDNLDDEKVMACQSVDDYVALVEGR